jgi:type II secretory pathway pseudopilin PulG
MAPGRRARVPPAARGFTYVGLLALLVLIGLLLAAAGEVASKATQREREAQLLWVGHEYRAAIGRYWIRKRAFPQTLEELLGATADAPVPVRYLRHLYPDPMTNAVDWVLVPALPPASGIMGVASRSQRAPIKTGKFAPEDQGFESAASYGDWKFLFQPGIPQPGAVSRPQAATSRPTP